MKRKLILAAVLLGVSAPALAAKQYLDVQAAADQQSRMDYGVEMVESSLPMTSARLFEPEERAKKRVAVKVMVYNAGAVPLNFGPENVTVETVEGMAVAVIPYERLLKEEKNRQAWAMVGMALGAAGNSMSASQAGYNYGTVNAYGNGGWATGTYSSYNGGQAYAAQSIANAQNQQMAARFQENKAAAFEALQANLRTTTVDPGEVFGGQITIELPPAVRKSKAPVDLLIRMRMGEEVHTFNAQVVRRS
jgi:hypothetical protein